MFLWQKTLPRTSCWPVQLSVDVFGHLETDVSSHMQLQQVVMLQCVVTPSRRPQLTSSGSAAWKLSSLQTCRIHFWLSTFGSGLTLVCVTLNPDRWREQCRLNKQDLVDLWVGFPWLSLEQTSWVHEQQRSALLTCYPQRQCTSVLRWHFERVQRWTSLELHDALLL